MSSKVRRRRRNKSDDLLDWIRELKPQDPMEWGGLAPYIGVYVTAFAEFTPDEIYHARDRHWSHHVALGALAYYTGAHKGAATTARFVGQRIMAERSQYALLRYGLGVKPNWGAKSFLGGPIMIGHTVGALATLPVAESLFPGRGWDAFGFVMFAKRNTGLVSSMTGSVGHGGYFDIVGNLSKIVNHYF